MALIGSEEETWPAPTQKGPGVKRYDVEINGVQTTLLLSDEDAKARGLKAETKEAKAPANKAAPKPASKPKADG